MEAVGSDGHMIWLISQFPELDRLEPEQRARLLARVPWWTYPVVLVRVLARAFLLFVFATLLLSSSIDIGPAAAICLPPAPIVAAFFYTRQLRRVRSDMRNVISQAFRGERPPFCFGCGYNLRDSDAERCPECGVTVCATPH